MCEDYTLRNVFISSKPSLVQNRQDPSHLRVHNRHLAGAQTYITYVQVRSKTGANATIVIPFFFFLFFFGIRHCQRTSGKKHEDTAHFNVRISTMTVAAPRRRRRSLWYSTGVTNSRHFSEARSLGFLILFCLLL